MILRIRVRSIGGAAVATLVALWLLTWRRRRFQHPPQRLVPLMVLFFRHNSLNVALWTESILACELTANQCMALLLESGSWPI